MLRDVVGRFIDVRRSSQSLIMYNRRRFFLFFHSFYKRTVGLPATSPRPTRQLPPRFSNSRGRHRRRLLAAQSSTLGRC